VHVGEQKQLLFDRSIVLTFGTTD